MATLPSAIQSIKSAHFPDELLFLRSISSGFMSILTKNWGASGRSTTHPRAKPALMLPPPKAHRKPPESLPAAVHSASSSALVPPSSLEGLAWIRNRFLGRMSQGTCHPRLDEALPLLEEDMMIGGFEPCTFKLGGSKTEGVKEVKGPAKRSTPPPPLLRSSAESRNLLRTVSAPIPVSPRS